MKSNEVLNIKKYVEGAYPQLKKDADADVVWLDMLKNYSYNGIMASVKNYIESGNKFPPTLADIVSGYKVVLNNIKNEILNRMIDSGFFDDPEGSDEELADWNKEKRIHKASYYLSETPKETWPKFFKEEYQKYENEFIEFGGKENVKRLELSS